MQRAQDQKAFVVRRQRAQHPQQGEGTDGAKGEAPQRERDATPGRKCHGRHRGRGVAGDQPGAFVVADGQGASNIGQGHLGHHLVQARYQHREQYAHQADDDPRAEDRWCGGCRAGRGERGRDREGRHYCELRDLNIGAFYEARYLTKTDLSTGYKCARRNDMECVGAGLLAKRAGQTTMKSPEPLSRASPLPQGIVAQPKTGWAASHVSSQQVFRVSRSQR
ncbi:hypothetical protein D3C76_1002090 [compost metagenome]